MAEVLDAEPLLSTATDQAGLPGLDTLGWPVEGAVAAVSRAMLDGEPVRLVSDATWPLPAFPRNVRLTSGPGHPAPEADGTCEAHGTVEDGVGNGDPVGGASHTGETGHADGAGHGYRILVTDRMAPVDGRTVLLRPPSLAVGVGASRRVSAAEVLSLIDAVLDEAGLSPLSVAALATVDAKADEPGITEAAARRGWPLVSYPAAVLAAVAVPNPSAAALAAVGTPSVAEAAALTRGDALVAGKHKSAKATAAVARIRPRGRLALVGLGPGARDLLAPRAVAELRRASVVAAPGPVPGPGPGPAAAGHPAAVLRARRRGGAGPGRRDRGPAGPRRGAGRLGRCRRVLNGQPGAQPGRRGH